jgi:hypothetical protein
MLQTVTKQGTFFDQAAWRPTTVYNVGTLVLPPQPSAPKFSTPRRTRQDELIRRHHLFGGRNAELGQLDALLRYSPNAFHFIYGPSGFGKTALLANWVTALQANGQPVCYRFTSRLEGMADEDYRIAQPLRATGRVARHPR